MCTKNEEVVAKNIVLMPFIHSFIKVGCPTGN